MDKLFTYKRTYNCYDGDELINMSIPAVNVDKIQCNRLDRVNQDEKGRLDSFVWRAVAKNLNMIDIVMYANHIFNPFAVNEDDILYVPLDDDKDYVNSSEPSLPDGTKLSKSSRGEKTMSYAEKVEYLARQGLGLK